jgi:hypothetical protein
MKKFFLPLLTLLISVSIIQAQERYLDPVFTDVSVTTNVIYGVNATVLLLGQVGEAVPQPLTMDVYEPQGDTENARPLVIMLHTGNFLPPQVNGGCNGTKEDENLKFMANELAKRGYVVAVANYRLGWNPIAPDQTERVFTLINAAYRGVQDSRTCVRFFNRSIAEQGNPFGIDSDKISLFGVGTGGYISMASSTLDTITDTWIPKFITPAGPMVIEQINGDINGETVGIVPPGYPGFPAGDTLCYPNHVGYSSDFAFSINLGGALGDESWLDANDPPMISVHVPSDPFAPCEEGIVLVPVLGLPVVDVIGSCFLQPAADALGINDIFKNYTFIDPVSTVAASRASGLQTLLLFPSNDPTESSQWNYSLVAEPYGVAGSNCDTDVATAQVYVDSIMQFFLPRACIALNLGCNLEGIVPTTEVIGSANVNLQLFPNPADRQINLQTDAEHPILDVLMYDLQGRLVQSQLNIKQNFATIERGNLPQGMYLLQLRFEEGIVTKKVSFQ